MWEASASTARTAGQPFPVITLGPTIGGMLVDACAQLVGGVGDHERAYWHTDSVSVHVRLPLDDAEMAQLPDGWLACPAVDRGGREDQMRRNPPWPRWFPDLGASAAT